MKKKCLQVGEPDAEGMRSFTFEVPINSELILYQVHARTEQDAQDKLRGYVESDATNLQQLGAAGAAVSFVVVGAIVYGVYLVAREIAKLIPAATAPKTKPQRNPQLGDLIGGIKTAAKGARSTAKPAASAATARSASASRSSSATPRSAAASSARPATVTGSATPRSATASSARPATVTSSASRSATASSARPATVSSASSPRAAAATPGTARRAPVVNGDTDGAPGDDDAPVTAPGAVQASPVRGPAKVRPPSWRDFQYNGASGKIAGGDPTAAIRVVVYSDTPVDSLLPLVRQSSYDAEKSRLRDPIVLMWFPVAAAQMRAADALEVMIGDSPVDRSFDVKAATPEEALGSIREMLSIYL